MELKLEIVLDITVDSSFIEHSNTKTISPILYN